MPFCVRAILTALGLALPALGQSGTYSFFGTGCSSGVSAQPPRLVQEGPLRPGKAFTVAVEDGGRAAAGTFVDVLLTGTSNTVWSSFALPVSLAALGPCPLRVSPDAVLLVPPGPLSVAITIPNNVGLVGFTFYQQWVTAWIPSGATQAAFSLSDGGVGVVGT